MKTKFNLIIDDTLIDFLPGGKCLLCYLNDFKINE